MERVGWRCSYYGILGIDPHEMDEEIRTARKSSQQGIRSCSDRYNRIQDAYEALFDDLRRSRYDLLLGLHDPHTLRIFEGEALHWRQKQSQEQMRVRTESRSTMSAQEYGEALEEKLNKLTIPELKARLRHRHHKLGGRKYLLVRRLMKLDGIRFAWA